MVAYENFEWFETELQKTNAQRKRGFQSLLAYLVVCSMLLLVFAASTGKTKTRQETAAVKVTVGRNSAK